MKYQICFKHSISLMQRDFSSLGIHINIKALLNKYRMFMILRWAYTYIYFMIQKPSVYKCFRSVLNISYSYTNFLKCILLVSIWIKQWNHQNPWIFNIPHYVLKEWILWDENHNNSKPIDTKALMQHKLEKIKTLKDDKRL